jgi:excinuclease ABC subunit C
MNKSLRDKVKAAPDNPGVYIFKDNKNHSLYIGKAANLKSRLSSYLNLDETKNRFLARDAADLDIIITNSDVEALTLEESLIKLHKPRYNVRLKDDKKFPYLKITLQERFPRIMFTRDIKPDGSLIFGPYTNARALRQTRDALCRIFKLVSCEKDLSQPLTRACLEYNMGRCSAPCTGNISDADYRILVQKSLKFLQGQSDELEQELEKIMWKYAEQERFEAASTVRDQLIAIRRISQRQQVVTSDTFSEDVIGFARSRRTCTACLFRIREGRLIAKETFNLKISSASSDEEIASAFIRLIYTHLSFVPEIIVILATPLDWDIQSHWFKERGFKVRLSTGKKGDDRRLLKWAQKNAESELSSKVLKKRVPAGVLDLQNLLHLNAPPRWIEAFDVSNLKDKFAVGSSVAFRDGKPNKQRYRHYRIKRTTGQNDVAMIYEIVTRRIKDLKTLKKMPDLLLIDGGKGQLHAALTALKDVEIDVPVYALAKRYEELYDRKGNVVAIPATSKTMYLLMRIRDEAHRFAVKYHRTLRGRTVTRSVLDSIPGIGAKRKLMLLKHFGSAASVKKASEEEIAKVANIGRKTARRIYDALHP